MRINGQDELIRGERQDYLLLDRSWQDGDVVQLTLPMQIRLRHWPQNHGSVSVDRGPLTYSLKIGEQQVKSGGTPEWPAWEILPTTPWNYGLVLAERGPDAMEVVTRDWPATDMPFTHKGDPLEIKAQGKRIPAWKLDRHGLVAELQDGPVKSGEPAESITLIPMARRMRIASFPVIGDGPDAHDWQAD